MNIKEVEALSGMTRANIRFYEQEGLIAPLRHDNGYRDYNHADLETLQRIRLLRTLGLGIEEIRALQKGELTLQAALTRRTTALQQQATQLQRHQQVCRDLCSEGATYQTLDAQPWLKALEEDNTAPAAVPAADTCQKVRAPWRRFFARHFDLLLYSILWILLGFVLLGQGPSSDAGAAWNAMTGFVALIFMLLLEPLFLSTWGTTPGKWLLGLHVRNNTGSKLTYSEGLYRTVQALWYGAGFFLPIVELFRGYKCYYDCAEGKTLPWEWDSELTLKDEKNWRIAAYSGSVIALFCVLLLTAVLSTAPKQRGDMPVAQFAENYNRLARYHGIEVWLDEEGCWTEVPRPDGGVTIHMSDMESPNFVYTEQDGHMTGLSFTLTVENDTETWLHIDQNRRTLAILAYVQAYDPTPLNNDEVMAFIRRLESDPFSSAAETIHGVRITWNFSSAGYYQVDDGGMLIPIEGETPVCTMRFTMEKVS